MSMESERSDVARLGRSIGFGAVMQHAEAAWREELGPLAGGEHSTGPCVTFLVTCPHITAIVKNPRWLDRGGHCDWCCGCGRVTKRVADAMMGVKP